ncbi:MAG TPA: DUF4255 domain-containing protein [Allosphingosinicella sp.]
MAKFTVISDVSLELRRQIYGALVSASDINFNLAAEAQAIFIGPPDFENMDSQAVAALYLYHVVPSKHLRNQRPLPDPVEPGRFRLAPLPVELRYLLVPLAEDETGHQHLGRMLQHFHDHRTFAALSGEPIGDSFGGGSKELRVSIDPLSVEQMTQLWSAFSSPFRLSVGLLVELVPIDSARPPDTIPRVDEALVLTGTMP